ncbi:hypothetical protein ACFWVP_22865 [Streptomyces sp. NPDC058637]|uniref:hypothetical protein n=1 Tax=Streptomyces sp. NPDC058637 TaxID=3346569 RepID=UPI0036531EA6
MFAEDGRIAKIPHLLAVVLDPRRDNIYRRQTHRQITVGRRFGFMRGMDDVQLTADEINDLLGGDDHGAGWDEAGGYEWVR